MTIFQGDPERYGLICSTLMSKLELSSSLSIPLGWKKFKLEEANEGAL